MPPANEKIDQGKMVFIANHSAREITFDEPVEHGKPIIPKKVMPGRTIALEAAFWGKMKKHPAVKGLLERMAIEEVKKDFDTVPIGVEKTADPEIPEHLRADEQVGAQTGQTAKLVKAEKKTIDLPAAEG